MTKLFATRDLDPERDGWFFHAFAPVSDADRARIRPLDDASSEYVWGAIVGERVAVTGLVRDGWLRELSRSGDRFEWATAWHAGNDDWAAAELRPRLLWPDDAQVLFLWQPTWSIVTSFDVFLRCWRAFLFEDEGPLLINVIRPEVVWFWATGVGRVGRRPAGRDNPPLHGTAAAERLP